MSATHVPVHTTRNYHPTPLEVIIRPDLKRLHGWAFVASPNYFCATAEQLRDLANAFHDMADQIERD